MEDHQITIPMM